jgi:L-2-hydroxyglutarate oxidase
LTATNDAEVQELDAVHDRVDELGIEIERLDADGINSYEPNVTGKEALYTPDSSTVETQPITFELAKDARQAGVEFYMGTEVQAIEREDKRMRIATDKGPIETGYLVNAAGTAAVPLAQELGVASEFSSILLRGQYYELETDRRDFVRTNVYPVSTPPRVPNQVGVHFTRRPDNKVIVGPTGMIALGQDTYGVTEFNLKEVIRMIFSSNFWQFISSTDTLRIAWRELNKTYRKEVFLKHCKNLVPMIDRSDISRSYVGISHYVLDRHGEIGAASRFATGERSTHILRPKPGLTSLLTIGDHIAEQVCERF